MATGALIVSGAPAALALVGISVAAAPLILIGLAAGITVQWVWGAYGGADWAGSAAERILRP